MALIDPVSNALEAFLAIFQNIPSSVYSLVTLILGLFIIVGVLRFFLK